MNIIDFQEIISKFCPDFTNEEISTLTKDILKIQDSQSKINYMELMGEIDNISAYNQDTKMWMTYNKYSSSDTGFIKYSNLKSALKDFSIEKTDDDLRDLGMILKIPTNEDIDFEQFKMIVNHKSKSKY